MAKLYKTNGSVVEVAPRNGRDFSLDELYSLLGCELIEIVHLKNNNILVIDEEGKLRKKAVNIKATIIYGNPLDCIVGDALACKKSEVR